MRPPNRAHPVLGCLSLNAIAVAGLVGLIVAVITLTQGGVLFSPGGLNAQAAAAPLGGVVSHAEITRCEQCHPGPFSGTGMADACLACHTELSQNPKNFHQQMLAEGRLSGCHTCHTEHHGANAALTQANMADFPHNRLRFALQAHPSLADGSPFRCSDCHPAGYAGFDPSVCADCHRQAQPQFVTAHAATFGSSCLNCHDGLDRYGQAFDHQQVSFPLQGKHAPLTCETCHSGARTPADLAATPTGCATCHAKDDGHKGQYGPECGACHTPTAWRPSTFNHASVFALTGAHQRATCAQCHVRATGILFLGTPTQCAGCHADPPIHKGMLGSECQACHSTSGWSPATFDHAKSVFPLVGKHQTTACVNCHAQGIFKGTPQLCAACHAGDDAHKGQYGQECGGCHTPTAWKPATFNHARSAFPLTGAHVRVSCAQCHSSGSGMIFKGTRSACVGCHADPAFHRELFGVNCATCHTPNAWRPAQFNRAHTFPVAHGRGGNTCRTCHPASLRQYTCTSCHSQNEMASRHRGQGDITNCVKCHPTGREDH